MMRRVFTEKLWGIWLFLLLVAVFFWPTLVSGKLPVPSDALVGLYHPWRDELSSEFPRGMPFKNFLITDPVRQQIPWRKIAIDQWKHMKIPSWNPFGFSGTPLNANIQAGSFYPLNVIFFIVPFHTAWTILIVIQPMLAGIFLYIFLRNLKLSTWSSLMGAILWSFGGFSIAWLTWGTMLHTSLWAPLVLLCIDKMAEKNRKKGWWWTIVFSFSLVSTMLAGHAQLALYVLMLTGVYAYRRANDLRTYNRKDLVWKLFIGVAVSMLVSTIAWLPFLRLVLQTSRIGDASSWTKPGWFIPWRHLAQFVAPDYFGNPTTLNYWGEWNYGEFVGYISIVSLIFVFLSLQVKKSWLWALVLCGSLLFALPNPVSRIPYMLQVPILSALQPTRLMMLIVLSMSVLAAIGFEKFLTTRRMPINIVYFVGLILAVLWAVSFAISPENATVAKRNLILPTAVFVASISLMFLVYARISKNLIAGFIVILVVFDLFRFGWKFTPFTDIKYFFPQTQITVFLQKQSKPYRIASMDSRVLPPNVSAYYGIESIEGYDPISFALYEEFIAAMERGRPDISPPYGFNRIITPHAIDSTLFPLLGAKFILSMQDIDRPFLHKVFQDGDTRVYEDDRAVPRVFFVQEVKFVKENQDVLSYLFEPGFNAFKTSYASGSVTVEPVIDPGIDTVEIVAYDAGKIVARTQTNSQRFLVIGNIYYPGWEARVDSQKVSIFQTNHLFQGIVVPSGSHEVLLRFKG